MKEVPVWEKTTLTLEEAAAYTGIGICNYAKLQMTNQISLYCG